MALLPAPSQDLWHEALQSIAAGDRDLLSGSSLERIHPSAVLDIIKVKLEVTKRERWTAKLGGRVFVFRNAFENIARFIQLFIQAGDVAVQYDPAHAALPWAVLRVLLQASVNNFSKHAAITEGAEEISRLLAWSRAQEVLVRDELTQNESLMRRSFLTLYKNILTFLANSRRFQTSTHPVHTVKSFLTSDAKFQTILDSCREAQTVIGQFTTQSTHRIQIDIDVKVDNALSILEKMRVPLHRIEYALDDTRNLLSLNEMRAVLDWLSDMPTQEHYAAARDKILPGTGQWLVHYPLFQQWLTRNSSELFWLRGDPGAGKSTLLSIVLQQVLETHTDDALANPSWFYCSRSAADPHRSNPIHVMRSLLRQIGGHSVRLKERHRARKPLPNVSECTEMILDAVKDRYVTYIFVDALDECNRVERPVLLKALSRILNESAGLVKIFLTSRNDPDLIKEIEKSQYLHVTVGASVNQNDIDYYVSEKTDQLVRDGLLSITRPLVNDIKQIVSTGAHGMFRWAELQLLFLCTMHTPSAIKQRLGGLPNTLGESYLDLYNHHVPNKVVEEQELIQMIFSLLLVSQIELGHAQLESLVTSAHSDQSLSIDQILSLCFNLVVYDRHLDRYRFSHLSVREFLESKLTDFSSTATNARVSAACLSVLELEEADKCPGLYYAQWHWAYHAGLAGFDKTASFQDRLERFVSPYSAHFEKWSEDISSGAAGFPDDEVEWRIKDSASDIQIEMRSSVSKGPQLPQPILVVALLGLETVLEPILMDQTPDELAGIRNIRQHDPFYIAVKAKHPAIVQRLLEFGLSPNVPVKDYSPLEMAARNGDTETARILIEAGAEVESLGVWRMTPLQSAAMSGSEALVRLLLRHKASVNPRHCNVHSKSPLQWAVRGGNERIVRLLLARGADINAPGKEGFPLWEAACNGDANLVSLLLDRGALIDMVTSYVSGSTALQIASRYRRKDVVEMLLKRGAPVNQIAGERATALIVVACTGYYDIMELLLKNGADVNIVSAKEGTALAAITRHSCWDLDAARLLLDNGAELFEGQPGDAVKATNPHKDLSRPIRELMQEYKISRMASVLTVSGASDKAQAPLEQIDALA